MTDYWREKPEYYFDIQFELKHVILHPHIRSLIKGPRDKSLLDLGCGDGRCAIPLLDQGAKVVFADKSSDALSLAKRNIGNRANANIVQVSPNDYTSVINKKPFDYIIVCLVLVTIHDDDEVTEFLASCFKSCHKNTKLILADSHPCFRTQSFSTFSMHLDTSDYRNSGAPFKVEVWDGITPSKNVEFYDCHRTLEQYSNLLFQAGFSTFKIYELYDVVTDEYVNKETFLNFNKYFPPYIVFETTTIS